MSKMTRKIRLIFLEDLATCLDLGQFTVWNQVTDAMKWRRGRYGRECSLGRSASGIGKLLEFENSDLSQINPLGYLGRRFGFGQFGVLDGLPLDRANVWRMRMPT